MFDFTSSRIFFYSCLAFLGGIFIYTFIINPEGPKSRELLPFYGKEVFFEGRIVSDPEFKEKSTELIVQPTDFREKVLILVERSTQYKYGDILSVSGKLQAVPRFEDFNYQGYSATKGIYGLMIRPKIELKRTGQYYNIFELILAKILQAKNRFREVIFEYIPFNQSAILGALLLGDQSRISSSLKEKLNITGLRHITAISGQHVVIILNMLFPLFLGFGFWRKQAIILSILCIVLFIVLTGAQASAVRAGIMGGSMLFSQYVGRNHTGLRSLVFAGVLMTALNPFLLRYDVGFQLSFLAVLGIIISLSFFQRLFQKIPEVFGARTILSMNFSAQLFTLPLLIYNFGYVSLVSPFSNLLLLPIIPFLLSIGFIFLIVGSLVPILGFLLSLPVSFLLTYFFWVVDIFSQLPFASLAIENLHPIWLLFGYSLLFLWFYKFQKKQAFPV